VEINKYRILSKSPGSRELEYQGENIRRGDEDMHWLRTTTGSAEPSGMSLICPSKLPTRRDISGFHGGEGSRFFCNVTQCSVAVGYRRFGGPVASVFRAARSFKKLISYRNTTRCQNPEDLDLYQYVDGVNLKCFLRFLKSPHFEYSQ
jgi:hypothetical protein